MARKAKATTGMRTTSTPESEERLHLRIPADLKDAARKAAAEDGRTLSNYVLQLLRERLARKGKIDG